MTEDHLKEIYGEGVRIARAELRMRQYVFRNQPDKLTAKVAEMDRLLAILQEMKDALKPHVEREVEQGVLFDVPQKAKYQ